MKQKNVDIIHNLQIKCVRETPEFWFNIPILLVLFRIHEAKARGPKRLNCPHHSHYPENPSTTLWHQKRIKLYKSLFGIRQDRGISLIIFLQILQLLALQLRKNRLAAEKLNENGRKIFKM